MLAEISQAQMDKYCTISHTCGIHKNHVSMKRTEWELPEAGVGQKRFDQERGEGGYKGVVRGIGSGGHTALQSQLTKSFCIFQTT